MSMYAPPLSAQTPAQPANRPLPLAAARILVIEDEPDLLTLYELTLVREGYDITPAANLQIAKQHLMDGVFDLVVTDMRLPDGSGMDILQLIQAQRRSEPCMVITAFGSTENAVEALKAGAFDYLTKPVDLKRLRQAVRTCLQGKVVQSLASLSAGSTPASAAGAQHLLAGRIVGDSPVMQALRQRIIKVAPSMAPVLIHGESGTGKELVAKAIHDFSHRASGPFVAVNCGAIPDNLLEAEFFGVKKGAYTGAASDRIGYFQAAQGGTLFLDEIGDLPVTMQPKLLRAIQERMVRSVGGAVEEAVDVRIVSATHKNLAQEVSHNRFRQDLFYRLHVIGVEVAPLRARREDLAVLCQHLLTRLTAQDVKPLPVLSPESMHWLQTHALNGNVRELENILHRAYALHDEGELQLTQNDFYDTAMDFSEPMAAGDPEIFSTAQASTLVPDVHLDASLLELERVRLQAALVKSNNNQTKAAQLLGLTVRQIRYRLAKLGLKP